MPRNRDMVRVSSFFFLFIQPAMNFGSFSRDSFFETRVTQLVNAACLFYVERDVDIASSRPRLLNVDRIKIQSRFAFYVRARALFSLINKTQLNIRAAARENKYEYHFTRPDICCFFFFFFFYFFGGFFIDRPSNSLFHYSRSIETGPRIANLPRSARALNLHREILRGCIRLAMHPRRMHNFWTLWMPAEGTHYSTILIA